MTEITQDDWVRAFEERSTQEQSDRHGQCLQEHAAAYNAKLDLVDLKAYAVKTETVPLYIETLLQIQSVEDYWENALADVIHAILYRRGAEE